MRGNFSVTNSARLLPTSGSSAADGGRVADSPSPNSNDEEDIAMNHDSNEGEYSELSSEHDSTWIDVVTKAQKRRQRKLNDEVGPTAVPKPPTPLPVRKAGFRPNPLPRDDFKLVLRPQDGLKLANLDIAEVSLALLNSINFTWRQANLRVRVDATQNTATISTPSSDAAKALGNLKQLKIGNTIHMVTLYGLAPDDSSKGLVRGVPLRFSDAEILANSDQSQFEIYTCRRLGQSKMVILTFAGLKVPFFVTLFGGEYPVSLYKKTIPRAPYATKPDIDPRRVHNQKSMCATSAASETLTRVTHANLCAPSVTDLTSRRLGAVPSGFLSPTFSDGERSRGRRESEPCGGTRHRNAGGPETAPGPRLEGGVAARAQGPSLPPGAGNLGPARATTSKSAGHKLCLPLLPVLLNPQHQSNPHPHPYPYRVRNAHNSKHK